MTTKHTSAEQIRRALADRIITGALMPGDTIDEMTVATEFGVSRTPVREAIRMLAASGLVDHQPRARTLVARPDPDVLAGMFDVMGYLEALCAALAAASMNAAERRALDALHDAMSDVVRRGDRARYTQLNEDFHGAIYDGSHNAYLAEITRSTRLRLRPFRHAQFSALGRLARSHAEHGQIVEAILRGDSDAARTRMSDHIAIVESTFRTLIRRTEETAFRTGS
mgnify:CR=1 FL=1